MKLRNGLFSLLVCILLISPGILFGVQSMNSTLLPGWLTSKNAEYLSGGVKDAYVRKNLSIDGILNGDLQESLQTVIGNHIPLKASVLLGNAAMQRFFIKSSNDLFGYDCYPTYYGSSIAYVSNSNALSNIPNARVLAWPDKIREFGVQLTGFAAAHPDIEFKIIIPDMIQTSLANPARELVSQKITTKEIVEAAEEAVAAANNVTVCSKTYSNFDEYLTSFYYTDGHWNGYGAIAAYNELLRKDGSTSFYAETPNEALNQDAFIFNGQNSRIGLMLLNRTVNEPKLETASLSVEEGARGYALIDNGIDLMKHSGLHAEYNFYALWYGADEPTTICSNENENGNALVISDSFGDAIRWVIASDYERTYGIMDLYGSSEGDATLEEHLVSSGAKTVFFVATPGTYLSFFDKHPHYFD